MQGLCHNTLTPARTPTLHYDVMHCTVTQGLCHNTLTPARTQRLHYKVVMQCIVMRVPCHNTLSPRLKYSIVIHCIVTWGLCHNTLTPARTSRLHYNVVVHYNGYVGPVFIHAKSPSSMQNLLHKCIHSPDMEINPSKLQCVVLFLSIGSMMLLRLVSPLKPNTVSPYILFNPQGI